MCLNSPPLTPPESSDKMTSKSAKLPLYEATTDVKDIFSEARDLFLGDLSDKERSLYSNCQSAEVLLSDLRSFAVFKHNHARWSQVFDRLKTFTDRLEPYFEIIGIFIQSNPEWTAIAWGAIRLILQVGFHQHGRWRST